MTSVFSSITWRAKERPRRMSPTVDCSTSGRPTPLNSPFDPDSLVVEPEEPDLRELNASLQALTDIFPDIQPEVFREMLSNFSEESRLQLVTEHLLKNGAKWVQGRYRTPGEQEMKETRYRYKAAREEDTRGVPLALEDKFRNESYKDAVKAALYYEFKGLSHSTIRAVLAEYNYCYTQARPTLLALVSKSWRYSITSFLMRRKPPSAESHPLIAWRPANPKLGGPAIPELRLTRNPELNKELHDTLIAPVLAKQKADQVARDRELAEELNEAEAEGAGEMYDCECCFTPSTMEGMSACDAEGHYICFRCIQHSVNEALYGQGWARNINVERGTLRCIAPLSDSVEDCEGCIPQEILSRAIYETKEGETTWRRLQDRCGTEVLLKTGLPLIQCPFCSYAEIDDFHVNALSVKLKLKNPPAIALSIFSFSQLFYVSLLGLFLRFLFLFLFSIIALNYLLPSSLSLPLSAPITASLSRLRLKRRGLRFTCLSPTCGRPSCLSCHTAWHDPHVCRSASDSRLTSLRTHIERAITDAVKRTCPACNLSFVKSAGCNKLTCVCGYTMCYVCRAEIGAQSYAHFCQHFRLNPGDECAECDRCDLYRVEDEEIVVRRAREVAEREWSEREGVKGKEWTWEEKEVARGFGAGGTMGWVEASGVLRRETWEGWLDRLMDAVVA